MTSAPGGVGLQPERTALAWQRTAITAAVVMVPLVVVNARLGFWLMTILGSTAAAAAGVLVVGVRRRFAQLMDQDRPYSPFEPMCRVATVTVMTGFVALVTALVLLLS